MVRCAPCIAIVACLAAGVEASRVARKRRDALGGAAPRKVIASSPDVNHETADEGMVGELNVKVPTKVCEEVLEDWCEGKTNCIPYRQCSRRLSTCIRQKGKCDATGGEEDCDLAEIFCDPVRVRPIYGAPSPRPRSTDGEVVDSSAVESIHVPTKICEEVLEDWCNGSTRCTSYRQCSERLSTCIRFKDACEATSEDRDCYRAEMYCDPRRVRPIYGAPSPGPRSDAEEVVGDSGSVESIHVPTKICDEVLTDWCAGKTNCTPYRQCRSRLSTCIRFKNVCDATNDADECYRAEMYCDPRRVRPIYGAPSPKPRSIE